MNHYILPPVHLCPFLRKNTWGVLLKDSTLFSCPIADLADLGNFLLNLQLLLHKS